MSDEEVSSKKRLAREVNIWARFEHPNLLPLIGFCLDEEMTTASLISPYEANGHIADYLEKNQSDERTRLQLVCGCLRFRDRRTERLHLRPLTRLRHWHTCTD